MNMLGEGRTITGYEMDIINAIAAETGLTVKFTNTQWSGIFDALDMHQADIVASSVNITADRKAGFLFSEPYYEVRQAVVVSKNSTISKPEDLKSAVVGVQFGSTAVASLKAMNIELELRTYDDMEQSFDALREGRLTAVVCDDPVGSYYAARKKEYANTMKVAFFTTDAEPLGFVFRKDSKELRDRVNQGLASIRKNGKEQAIRAKWLNQ